MKLKGKLRLLPVREEELGNVLVQELEKEGVTCILIDKRMDLLKHCAVTK